MRKTYERAKKVYILIGIALILSVFFTSVIIGQRNLKSEALTSSTVSEAIDVYNGVDLWNSSSNEINSNVANALFAYIFGDNDADDYIDTNGKDYYGSQVLQSKYINENIHIDGETVSNEYGLVITLGGLQWLVASVTRDNTDNENIVCTLYLANSHSSITNAPSATDSLGYNAYCNLISRKTLVADASKESIWGLFRHTTEGDFAEQYLVQPKRIDYQLYQNFADFKVSGATYTNGSDALLTPENTPIWPKATYENVKPETTFNYNGYGSAQRYDAWGEDYIWVPSIGEVGSSTAAAGTGNFNEYIWGLTAVQRTFSNNLVAVMRSGYYNTYGSVHCNNNSGSAGVRGISTAGGLRPAIHLNLTAAGLISGLLPEDTEVVYTGEALDVATVASIAEAKWYTSKLASNIQSGNVIVSYTSGVLTNGLPQNVGSYGISFTIQNLTDRPPFIWKGDNKDNPTIATQSITLTVKPKDLRATWSYNQETDTEPIVSFTGFVEGEDAEGLNITRKYTGRAGSSDPSDTSKMPTKIGDYTVTITDLGNSNYTVVSGASYDFHMESIKVPLPTIRAGTSGDYLPIQTFTNWYTYNATERIYYLTYETSQITISDFGGMTHSGSKALKATDAGTYELTLNLTDTDNMVWADNINSSAERKVQIKILPMQIELEVYSANDGKLTCGLETPLTVEFYLSENMFPKGTDSIDVYIKAINEDDDTWVIDPISDTFTINSSGVNNSEKFSIDLGTQQIEDESNWKLVFVVSSNNANYEFSLSEDVTLMMQAEDENGFIYWRLLVDGMYAEGQLLKVSILDTANASYKNKLTYNGTEFAFELNKSMPSGWYIDTSYNDNGYVNGYKNKVASDAGDYETSVRIIDGEGEPRVFTIEWNIQQAIIDLTNVKWLNDGELSYDEGRTVYAVIDESTLPKNVGLTAHYQHGDGGNRVGDVGVEEVYFTVDNDNYKTPTKGDTTTYTYKGSEADFLWQINYKVVAAEIALNWTSVTVPSGDFSVLVLKGYEELTDPNQAVSYLYYETDAYYNIVSGAVGKTYDQIVYDATNRQYFKALPSITSAYANDYTFPDGADLYSSGFVVGGGSTAVSIDLNKSVYSYNGYGVTLDLTITGQASKSDFNFAYYKNGVESVSNKMGSSPIEVGTYLVVITAKSSSNIVLSGNTKFTFKIEPAVIGINWNEEALPPVLVLEYGQISGVQYEMRDSDNNPITLSSSTPSGTYGIRAKIKSGQENNFIFDNGKTTTDWVQFTYTKGETFYDPNAADNPFYPQTPTETPDAPSEDGGNSGTTTDPSSITLEWANTNPPTLSAEQASQLNPTYKFYDENGQEVAKENLEKGKDYKVVVSFSDETEGKYNISGVREKTFTYKENITLEWDTDQNPPVLKIPEELEDVLKDIDYEYYDKDGNPLTPEDIANGAEVGSVKVILPDGVEDEYVFVNKDGEVVDHTQPLDPYADQEEPSAWDKIVGFLQDYWQPIVCGVALVLIIAFTAKGLVYANKRSKLKKEIKKKYTPAYALFAVGETLWGIEYKIWTILSFVLLGVAVLAFIFMLLEKRGLKHVQEELDEAKAEYARNPQAFAPQAATATTAETGAGSTTTIIATQPYAEDSKSSRKKDKEIARLEEELRKRDEEMKRREEESRKRDDKKSDSEIESLKEEMRRQAEESRRREEQRIEENRRRDEEMKMMFMSMLGSQNAGAGANDTEAGAGGNTPFGAGQPYGYPPYGMPYAPYGMPPYGMPQYGPTMSGGTNITIDAENIKGIITETVAALMPSMQAMLPQQAGSNDEMVKLLAEEIKVNKEENRKMMENQERLINKLIDMTANPVNVEKQIVEKPVEKVVEKIVEKPVEKIVEKKVEVPVEKIVEVPVEKVVEKIVEKPVEKIVEKKVEVPVEKIVEVPVEKIVEKEVVKEVKVEVPVEKVVEKIVKVPAEDKTDKKKTVPAVEKAPRLTIDEAYAKLSKEQKKFFDGLREYALTKDKCKEKKLTYNILLGQSSVNPLIKLTIKKDTTVALFKMEDEYFKDIRRNAEGQKIKVKESELIVADVESFETAKQMIDLREDQIDRYNEYLKEQKAYKN